MGESQLQIAEIELQECKTRCRIAIGRAFWYLVLGPDSLSLEAVDTSTGRTLEGCDGRSATEVIVKRP
jgi:hypothetical protein